LSDLAKLLVYKQALMVPKPVNQVWYLTTAEACSVNKQLARGLQAHYSADNCLASCLFNVASFHLSTLAF